MDHWLYRWIPASREQAVGLTWITWALFGNDEDGVFGEKDVNWASEISFRGWWLWWKRNPFHNLMFHVTAWNVGKALVLFESPPFMGLYRREHKNWVSHEKKAQVQCVVVPPFFSWKLWGLEGYIGWREPNPKTKKGPFGIALRRW